MGISWAGFGHFVNERGILGAVFGLWNSIPGSSLNSATVPAVDSAVA
jgi:hypothetical protein